MTWSSWFNLGAPAGGFVGAPETISRNGSVCNVYVRGADNALWIRPFYDGNWHEWESLGGPSGVLVPGVGSMGPDHEHYFVRGTDHNVWQKTWTLAGGWTDWFFLGAPEGGFVGGPATVSRNGSVCNVYVRGADDALWQRAFWDGNWHDWQRHDDGGVLSSAPAPGSMGPDHEHVFVRGTDGNVYQKSWTLAAGWTGWFFLGAPEVGFVGAPATVSRNGSVCNVYVRGADDALWQRAFWDGNWHDWQRHDDGGVLSSRPALGSMGPDHEHVFVKGTDGNVYQKSWELIAQPVGEVSFGVRECVYGWTARYRQAGTHVTVRIQLNPDAGISAATVNALQTTWRNGILATWSNRFSCLAVHASRQPITVDVDWVTANAHHVVRVRPGPARSNMSTWDTQDSGNVAAHEFGHMLGHPDEYADTACPSRNPVSTGTVMDDNTESVARHYNRIAGFHGAGHSPVAGVRQSAPTEGEAGVRLQLIDNLEPELRTAALDRLRSVAAAESSPEDARETEISFEITGGAPGERYAYRVGVRGDGEADRRVQDELRSEPVDDVSSQVDPQLVSRVFAAASGTGLLDDAAPEVPQQSRHPVPDGMIAVITVREGRTVRRIILPAAEPEAGEAALPDVADVPMATPVQLPAESVDALLPLLDALGAVEAAL